MTNACVDVSLGSDGNNSRGNELSSLKTAYYCSLTNFISDNLTIKGFL